MTICKFQHDAVEPVEQPPSHNPLRDEIADDGLYIARQNNLWDEPHPADKPQVLYCKFVNDHPDASYDARIKALVEKWAKEWEQYAFIQFVFVGKAEAAHIRIEFARPANDGEAWSNFGSDSVDASSQSEKHKMMLSLDPSMHFGDFSPDPTEMPEDVSDDQIPLGIDCARTTVLHEFGHALGLRHEHASPKASFVLSARKRRDSQYEKVTGSPGDKINVSDFDVWSIMRYPLEEQDVDWNKSRGTMNDDEFAKFKRDLQTRPLRLSDGDKVWAMAAYPGRIHPELEAAKARWVGTIEG
ncbi:hypothetical protein QBC42DRAFT_329848 [Cladorrhinum samala]|uniref:Peptidase M10 metallopeptidase domain-containing protein n=1 Tax=Cladorrhinum samala TaxID=585594 RepID=A0AAV9HL51_9PEZI|nr:hypothetical protein QBC42DRAFT_329848 [Cladorrhinum samala]